jgi:hypothetical protein
MATRCNEYVVGSRGSDIFSRELLGPDASSNPCQGRSGDGLVAGWRS